MNTNRKKIIGIALFLGGCALILGIVLFSIFGSRQIAENIAAKDTINCTVQINAPELSDDALLPVICIQEFDSNADVSDLVHAVPNREWVHYLAQTTENISLDAGKKYVIALISTPINPDGSFYRHEDSSKKWDGDIYSLSAPFYSEIIEEGEKNKEITFNLKKITLDYGGIEDAEKHNEQFLTLSVPILATLEIQYLIKDFGLGYTSSDTNNVDANTAKAINYLLNSNAGKLVRQEWGSETPTNIVYDSAKEALLKADNYVKNIVNSSEG